MSTLSNAAATGQSIAGTREKPAEARRAAPIAKPAPSRNIEDPLGDFSEQTGAQFG